MGIKKYDLAEIFKAEEDTKAELYKFWNEVNCCKNENIFSKYII